MTLDEDVAAEIKSLTRQRGATFKAVVNDLLRRGLRSSDSVEPYDPPTFSSGVRPGIDVDRAGRLAAALDDAELDMGE